MKLEMTAINQGMFWLISMEWILKYTDIIIILNMLKIIWQKDVLIHLAQESLKVERILLINF